MVLKHVAKIVVAFGEAVGKAFSRAVREEYIASKNAGQNQSSSQKTESSAQEAVRTNVKLGISLQESMQILDVKQPIDHEELEKRYKHLFEINDKSKGGTLYIQSKIFRAKERIDSELARIEAEQATKKAYKDIREQQPSFFNLVGTPEEVCDKLFASLLSNDKPHTSTPICSEEFNRAFCAICVDAAKKNIDADTFGKLLEFSSYKLGEVFVNSYKKHGSALREIVQTIGWEHPKVVGIDWSVLSVIESDAEVEFEEPLAEISFKVLPTGETTSKQFRFLCNKNQLQDFHWKVKEAQNFLQNFSHK